MYYKEVEKYKNEKDYTTAIDKLKEYLECKHITNEMRTDYKKPTLNCIYLQGQSEYNDKKLFICFRTI